MLNLIVETGVLGELQKKGLLARLSAFVKLAILLTMLQLFIPSILSVKKARLMDAQREA